MKRNIKFIILRKPCASVRETGSRCLPHLGTREEVALVIAKPRAEALDGKESVERGPLRVSSKGGSVGITSSVVKVGRSRCLAYLGRTHAGFARYASPHGIEIAQRRLHRPIHSGTAPVEGRHGRTAHVVRRAHRQITESVGELTLERDSIFVRGGLELQKDRLVVI